MKHFAIFLTILTAAGITFFVGSLLINRSASVGQSEELLLANNSLIARFNGTVLEKEVRPRGVVKLSNNIGEQPILSQEERELLFYSPKTGQVRSVPLSAAIMSGSWSSALAYQLKAGLTNLTWSFDKKEVVGLNNGKFIYYNLDDNKSQILTSDIKNLAFLNGPADQDGMNAAYLSISPETGDGGIFVADLKTGNKKEILKTRLEEWQMAWPTIDKVSLSNGSSLFLLDVETGDLKRIFDGKSALVVVWSPDGSKLIYSSAGRLFYLDLEKQKETDLHITADASRCRWNAAGDTIYCQTVDSFVSIDLSMASAGPATITTNPFGSKVDGITVYDPVDF